MLLLNVSWFNERHTISAGITTNFMSKRNYTIFLKFCNVSHNIFIFYHFHVVTTQAHDPQTENQQITMNCQSTLSTGTLGLGRRALKALYSSFIAVAYFNTQSHLVLMAFSCYYHTAVEFGFALFTLVSRLLLHNHNSCLEIT
jgi:hypothetical protein